MEIDAKEEAIQQEMQETRASLTEKLETLEQKVVGTVENATTAVTETVDAIKETVQDTVASVQEGVKGSVDSVKDFLDVPAQVERRPWLMMGGSVAVGYCLGTLLVPTSRSVPGPTPTRPASQPPYAAVPAATAPDEPSVWDAEVSKLKSLALGVLFGTARELLVSSIPKHMADQVKDVVDGVTKKMGGEPLPSSDWAKMCEPASSQTASAPDQKPVESRPVLETGNGHETTRRW